MAARQLRPGDPPVTSRNDRSKVVHTKRITLHTCTTCTGAPHCESEQGTLVGGPREKGMLGVEDNSCHRSLVWERRCEPRHKCSIVVLKK